jgi:hypothetical protein
VAQTRLHGWSLRDIFISKIVMKSLAKKCEVGLFVLVFLVSLIPVLHIGFSVGKEWKGIVPEYVEDSLYYYARIENVAHGYPLIGNPYFIEHRDEIAPAFFISDWLASVPLLLHIPFVPSIIFNIVLWSELFALFLYYLFRKFGATPLASCVFSFVTYLQVFWLFVRPVAMQVVFPAYVLFLLTLFLWMTKVNSKKSFWFLFLSSLYAVYSYTYLLQIVVVTYGILFLYYLFTKRWLETKELVRLLLSLLVGSIPFIWFTFHQVHNPLYADTIHRIGFVLSHVPRMDFFFYGRWVVVSLLLWALSAKWIDTSSMFKATRNFFIITGLSLITAAGSNIITGRELELANHIGRFIIVWFSISFLTCCYLIFSNMGKESLNWSKKSFLGLLIILGFFGMMRNIPRAFPFFRMNTSATRGLQNYAGAIAWLNQNQTGSVVLASDSFSGYVPIMTSDYVLFHPSGGLQLVSDREMEDRYLVSRFFFGGVSRVGIERDLKLYGGAGKALKAREMKDDLDAMYDRYITAIKPHIGSWLAKFNVQFVVINVGNAEEEAVLKQVVTQEVYRDANLAIFKILP